MDGGPNLQRFPIIVLVLKYKINSIVKQIKNITCNIADCFNIWLICSVLDIVHICVNMDEIYFVQFSNSNSDLARKDLLSPLKHV